MLPVGIIHFPFIHSCCRSDNLFLRHGGSGGSDGSVSEYAAAGLFMGGNELSSMTTSVDAAAVEDEDEDFLAWTAALLSGTLRFFPPYPVVFLYLPVVLCLFLLVFLFPLALLFLFLLLHLL